MTLAQSVEAGDTAAVLDLLRSGADVDARLPDGFTPLMIAAAHGRYHLAQALLTAGADVHAIEPRMGATALHKAAQAGNPDVISLLLEHGVFVDQQTPTLGNTPLIDAVLHKHQSAVERLLQGGARTVIANHWGQTALQIAQADRLEAIAAIIKAHDRALAGRTESLILVAAAKAGDVAEVERLIRAGHPLDEQVPVSGTVDDNYTPLGIAAREGHAEIVRILLEAGADAGRLIGLMGGMVLHDAVYFGHADVVRLLVHHQPVAGLDVQGAYNGLTALHDAVWHGHLEVAEALVGAGARLDARSHTGLTPHDLAQLYQYPAIAALLARASQPD